MGNMHIPLHTYLPPISDYSTFTQLSIIAIADPATNGNTTPLLDSSLFWIRVSPTSLNILTLALSAVLLDPNRSWGSDVAGTALSDVLRREEYSEKVLWQSAEWYFSDNSSTAFTRPSGGNQIDKLIDMQKLLDRPQPSLAQVHPAEVKVKEYWDMVVEAKQTLSAARDRGHTSEEGDWQEEVRQLKNALEMRTWNVEKVRAWVEELKGVLMLGEIVEWEAVVG